MGALCEAKFKNLRGRPSTSGDLERYSRSSTSHDGAEPAMTVTDRQPRYLVRAAVAAVETGGFASPSHDGFALALEISRASFVLEGKRLRDPTFACCNSIKQHGSRFFADRPRDRRVLLRQSQDVWQCKVDCDTLCAAGGPVSQTAGEPSERKRKPRSQRALVRPIAIARGAAFELRHLVVEHPLHIGVEPPVDTHPGRAGIAR